MIHPPRPLGSAERDALARHYLALDPIDRYLRFGASVSDQILREYVYDIDLTRDAVYGTFGAGGVLVGAAHVARGHRHAELGLSVLDGHRRRGIGGALLIASCAQCSEWGIGELYMRCAADNTAMRNLATAHGMRVLVQGNEADAYLPVPDPRAAVQPSFFVHH